MILHVCGNFCAGKSTTAEALRARLGWPVVAVGDLRARLPDEAAVWRAARRLWRAWDRSERTPGASGIWVSTGHNWREPLAWALAAPRWAFRAWVTAPPSVILERWAARQAAEPAKWRSRWWFDDEPEDLLQRFVAVDQGQRPFPLPVHGRWDTNQVDPDAVAAAVIARLRMWYAEQWAGGARPGEG